VSASVGWDEVTANQTQHDKAAVFRLRFHIAHLAFNGGDSLSLFSWSTTVGEISLFKPNSLLKKIRQGLGQPLINFLNPSDYGIVRITI